jgi:hypothetical protein
MLTLLASAGAASAGPFGWIFPSESQPNSYSPLRYWAPRVERVHDIVHGPKIDVYAPDRHPEIPPTFSNLHFPCPTADPASTLIERAAPPATSKFRY